MFKIIIFVLVFTTSLYADIQDYIIGLNAYKDGFDNMAAESLQKYVKTSKDKDKKQYANYILYKIYFNSNDYKTSYKYLKKIENVKDKRFDKSQINTDKMHILTNLDCDKASKFLSKGINSTLASIYLKSDCKINKTVSESVAGSSLANNLKTAYIIKLKKKPELAYAIAKTTEFNNISMENLKYLGVFFYNNDYFDIFWRIYPRVKNDRFVNMALKRTFEAENYKDFIKSFKVNRSNYEITPSNYCSAVNSYKNLNIGYDCDLIDKCFNDTGRQYIKAKTTCLLKSGKPEKVTGFIASRFKNQPNLFCSYSTNIVQQKLYNDDLLSLFKDCKKQKHDIANLLLKQNKPESVISFLSNSNDDKTLYLKTKAYILAGNTQKAEKTAEMIGNEKLRESLFSNEN